jgi:hypothetical protein
VIDQETLFIIRNAKWFGTEAGDVYQVPSFMPILHAPLALEAGTALGNGEEPL